jgi:hypothetical protein
MDALSQLRPVSDDYARLPVAEAFEWRPVAAQLGVGEWYLVAFRSIRRADADEARLTAFDEAAHAEAAGAPGFIHYFKGPLASDGSCLSFCIWTGRPEARTAAGRPEHALAAALVGEMYEVYTLELMRLTGLPDGTLTFEPYDRPGASPDVPAAA